MMSGAKKMVPKRRFKEFLNTGSWEQRKFGELMTFLNGRAYKQDELLRDGMYKVLRVGNFYTNDSWYYSDLELDDKYYAKNGDLLYTWSATFGPHIWKGEKVIYHYHIWKLVLQDKIDKLFALQLLEVDKASIISDKNGSTMVHITKQGMENKQTILPISLNEQKRIAKFLSSMDNLITLHQLKLDKLQATKKALLQEMFPEEGQDKPKRRFKGFTDAWEQRKLSEFVDKAVDNRGKTPPLDENGAHPLIEVAALGGVYPDYSKVEKYLSDDVFNTNLRAYIKKDDILFTTVGSIGLVSLMDSREEAAIAQNIVAFRAKENFLPEYLYALFSNEDNQYKAKRIAMVAVQPSIKVSQLVNVEYMISTNIEEQERIGVFFSSLQSLITLHQRKLDKLKNLKQAYLNEMFV